MAGDRFGLRTRDAGSYVVWLSNIFRRAQRDNTSFVRLFARGVEPAAEDYQLQGVTVFLSRWLGLFSGSGECLSEYHHLARTLLYCTSNLAPHYDHPSTLVLAAMLLYAASNPYNVWPGNVPGAAAGSGVLGPEYVQNIYGKGWLSMRLVMRACGLLKASRQLPLRHGACTSEPHDTHSPEYEAVPRGASEPRMCWLGVARRELCL